ncbi:MAG TPA: tetratricopeptide repeat protein [Tepidisphaeraceae bacterium]|jgi:tetratricopeptide (TPR) repeat protein
MSEEEIDPGLELILPDDREGLRDRLLWGAVLVILTLWAFSPCILGGYIWDDNHYPLNPVVQKGNDGLYDIWFNPSRPAEDGAPLHFVTPQYYPMTYTTYWLVYMARGIDPMTDHAINMLLQAGAALLVWEILRRLKVPGAWVAAAIFAIHPLQTESVAWLTERKNVLAGVFYFASILTYLQFLRIEKEDARPTAADFEWYGLALLLFICGLLSKSVVCSLPIVMAIILWWKHRLHSRNIALLFPFVILGLAMSMVTSWFEVHIVGASGPEWDHTWVQKIFIASHAIWFYAVKLLVPANLSFIYRKWALDSSQWIFVAATLIVLAILIAIMRKTGRGVLAAVLIYLVTLVPAMGFFPVYPMRYSYVADHFQYFSGIALIVLAVAIVAHLLRHLGNQRRNVGLVLAILVIGIFAIGSWSRAHVFANSEALWTDVINKNPEAWLAYEGRSGVLAEEAQMDLTDSDVTEGKTSAERAARQAIEDAQNALRLHPNLEATYDNWGQALMALNEPANALEKFQKAESINPKAANVHNNSAVALTKLNRTTEAENEYRQGIALPATPEFREVMRMNLGHLLMADGAAATREEQAAKTPTDKDKARKRLAAAYIEAGEQFQAATHDNPDDATAWYQLGLVLMRMNKDRPAFDAMEQAVQLDPQFADAHSQLGALYDLAGQYAQAGQEYLKVLTLQHDNADAYANMGLLAMKLKHPSEAREFLNSALKIDPNNARAKRELAELPTTMPTTESTTLPAPANANSLVPSDRRSGPGPIPATTPSAETQPTSTTAP